MNFLIITFAGFALAHVNNLTSLANGNLTPRAPAPPPQAVSDPDNEGYYVDPGTLTRTEKSKILDGLAPQDQKGRVFDWDASCSDPDDRAKILQAWNNVLVLAQDSAQALHSLYDSAPQPIGSQVNKQNRNFLADTDTAYAQMFKSFDTALKGVEERYDWFDTKVNKAIGVGARPPRTESGGIRFICSNNKDARAYRVNRVKDNLKRDYCAGDAQAVTSVPGGPIEDDSIEPKYRFEWSTGIVFCPPFFDDTKFPSIDQRRANALKKSSKDVTLNDLDCRERIMLHEYMHVKWMLDLKPLPDPIGYLEAAKYAKDYSRPVSNGGIISIADQWAWYTIYRSFNSQLCGKDNKPADVWPTGTVPKPCPTEYT